MDGVAVYSNTKKSRRRGGGIAVVGSRGPGVVLSSGETSVLRFSAISGRGVISSGVLRRNGPDHGKQQYVSSLQC